MKDIIKTFENSNYFEKWLSNLNEKIKLITELLKMFRDFEKLRQKKRGVEIGRSSKKSSQIGSIMTS